MPEQAATTDGLILWSGPALPSAVARLRESGVVLVLIPRETSDAFLPPATEDELTASQRAQDPAGYRLRRRIVREIASAATGHPAEAFAIVASSHGQPLLSGPGGLHVSFAARGGLSLVGIATCPVGVDLESIIARGEIPWNVLRPDETEVLRALPETARTEAFLDLWTGKEAILKTLGTGLHVAPEALWITRDGIVRQRQDPSSDKAWRTLPLQVSWLKQHDVFHNTVRIAFALLSNGDPDPFVPGQS